MKVTVTKEWFCNRAHLEEGHEIGAGSLQRTGKPALHVLPGDSTPTVSLGQTVSLMRRQRRWTIDRLADEAEATREEIVAIETIPDFVPELSTVVSLAKTFELPPKALVRKAGLAEDCSSRLREDSIRYAACSEFNEPLSDDEEHVLQAVLKAIIESNET